MDLTEIRDIYEQKIDKERKRALISLEQHRKELLLKYKLLYLPVNSTLFKAEISWPLFHSVEADYNGWKNYVKKVEVYKIPGTHETMFFHPHVKTLAKLVDYHFMSLRSTRRSTHVLMVEA